MSPWEAAADIAALWVRAPVLAGVYLGRMLDPVLRERIMVAVSRVNACAGCTAVHERWALRAGVSAAELEAIGLGDLARLDDRSRAAVVYAAALAENRFCGTADRELAALARCHLGAAELRAVEAVARMMALANLSAGTLGRASRAGGRQAGPWLAGGRPSRDAALLSGGTAATVGCGVGCGGTPAGGAGICYGSGTGSGAVQARCRTWSGQDRGCHCA